MSIYNFLAIHSRKKVRSSQTRAKNDKEVQLKKLEASGSFNSIKNNVVKGNKNLNNAGYVGDIYVDTTNLGMNRSQIMKGIDTKNGKAIMHTMIYECI